MAFIEHLDDCIGQVIDCLEASGLIDNTLVVFTSDNGGALRYAQSNGPLRGGKQDMYEGGIRVPTFILWKDRVSPGTVTRNTAIHMDLFATFCEVAGAEIPGETDGISLLPTLLGEEQDTGNRTLFWTRREGGTYGGRAYYAARRGDFKLVQNSPYEPEQLFRISTDEYEQNPVEEEYPAEFRGLRKELQEHIRQAGGIPWQNPMKTE